jgi:glycosyltransferase involved in cell wall biosynthesis
MRIAVDLRSLMETGGKISGVENYLLSILDRLPNDGYFGFYNSYRKVKMAKLKSGFEVKNTSIPNKILNGGLSFFNQPKFEKLYGKFDVLWMPDLRPFAIEKETKLAITVHDLSPVTWPELYSAKRRLWHRVVRYEKSFKRADLIFAVSEYTKHDLIKIFGVNPEKIKVIHSAIDHESFNPNVEQVEKQRIKNKYNLPDKFILSISTIEPRKNISSLISAFERIKDQETYLVIAGRLGWLYKDLLKQVNESSKSDRIILTDYVSEEDKPGLISLSEIVCYPSYYEGFGFVPLEAMACGVPVITSARTSMPEVCKDAAVLIEPTSLVDLVSALDSLLSDKSLAESYRVKGLQRAKEFTWQKTVSEVHRYLKELA